MKVAVRWNEAQQTWYVVGLNDKKRNFGEFDSKWGAMEHAFKCQDDPKCGVHGVEIFDRAGNYIFETIHEY